MNQKIFFSLRKIMLFVLGIVIMLTFFSIDAKAQATIPCPPGCFSSVVASGFSNYANDVHVSGNYAYVNENNGFNIVDISDPLNPVLVSSYSSAWSSNANHLYISGNYAYITLGNRFEVIDISDPAAPVFKKFITILGSYASNLYVSGSYCYLAMGTVGWVSMAGFEIIDISDPVNAISVGSHLYGDKVTGVRDISVSGDYAYVAYNDGVANIHSFDVFNISNPATPVLIKSIASPFMIRNVYVSGNYAYVSGVNSITSFDVSDPLNTIELDKIVFTDFTFKSHASGSSLYVANCNTGLREVDISDPSNLSLKETFTVPNDGTSEQAIEDVYISGNYGYLAGRGLGLVIVDLNAPDCIAINCCGNGVCDAGETTTNCSGDNCSLIPPTPTPTPTPPPCITTGLVPCGRICDNPATNEIDESLPCGVCALFYMLKKIIDFIVSLVGPLAILALIAAGLLYAFSGGDAQKLQIAKSAATSAVFGLVFVFLSWLIISTILHVIGYISFGDWNHTSCELPTKIIYTQTTIPVSCTGPIPNFNDDNCTIFNDAKINIPIDTSKINETFTVKVELDTNVFNQYGTLEILSPNGVIIATLESSNSTNFVCIDPVPTPTPIPIMPKCPNNQLNPPVGFYYNAEIFPNSCGSGVGCPVSVYADAIKYVPDPINLGTYLQTLDDACWRVYDPSGALRASHDFKGYDSDAAFLTADMPGTWKVELYSDVCASLSPGSVAKCYNIKDYVIPNPIYNSEKGTIGIQDITGLFNDTPGIYTVRVNAFSNCENSVRSASANIILTIAHPL